MRQWAETAIASVLMLIGGVYAYGILQIPSRELANNEIGPTTFPWVLDVLLVLLAAWLLTGRWLRRNRTQNAEVDAAGSVDVKIVIAALLILCYVLALPSLGFLWTTPLFIALLSMLYERCRLPVVAAVAVGVAVGLHFGMEHFFGVMLP